MPESKFVEAVSKSTGLRQDIPAAWLKIDMPPFNDFELPNQERDADLPSEEINTTPPPSAKAKANPSPAATSDSKKEAK